MDGISYGRGPVGAAAGAARRARQGAVVLASIVIVACSGDGVTDPLSDDGSTDRMDPKGRITPVDPTSSPSGNPLAGVSFYRDPSSNARRQADAWRSTRPADAEQMEKIAAQPQAKWIGSWLSNPTTEVANTITAAAGQNSVPVLVAYNIKNLDCGSGGATSVEAYRNWINQFANGVGAARAIVILEPDALPAMGCLSSAGQQERVALLRYAARTLKARPGIRLYIDAGHAAWQSSAEMANRLSLAGIENADGFSLNVSNFIATEANVSYGADLSVRLGGKQFVIDTSRNGRGPTSDYQWCNPDGRALGVPPTTFTAHPELDAYLWIKPPGESDGTCNGGPPAGAWWPEYALGLARRS